MRFWYVLLGLVTLTSLHSSSGRCSNGVAGVQDGDICCDAECGLCGGTDCAQPPRDEFSCCTSQIRDTNKVCSITSAAPCIIDDDELEEAGCSNGFPGVQHNFVCCETQCGTCGGVDCSQRPGGESSCCTGRIWDSGTMCSSTSAAPCIIDEEVPEEVCSNGVPGVQQDDFCCEAQCETCGGSDCGQQPGGQSSCCTREISDSGIYCSETPVAPCIIDDDEVPEAVCSNGVPGVQDKFFCCEAQCGTCGGVNCSQRPGGQFSCCMGRIWDSTTMCSTTSAAPCIIDEEVPEEVCSSNGVPGVQQGDFCCEAQCGTCGGSGCGQRPGGQLSCCTSRIKDSDIYCSDTPVAPCIIDEGYSSAT